MSASPNGIADVITPAQVGAGRASLELEAASRIPKRTIARLALQERDPQRRTVGAIRAALEAAGVEFTSGGEPGVKLRKAEL